MIVGGESPQMVAVSIAGLFQHLATNWQRFEEFGACFFLGCSSLAWLPFWARFFVCITRALSNLLVFIIASHILIPIIYP